MMNEDPYAPAVGMPSESRGLVIDAFSEDLGDRAAKIFEGSKWWDHLKKRFSGVKTIWLLNWYLMDI